MQAGPWLWVGRFKDNILRAFPRRRRAGTESITARATLRTNRPRRSDYMHSADVTRGCVFFILDEPPRVGNYATRLLAEFGFVVMNRTSNVQMIVATNRRYTERNHDNPDAVSSMVSLDMRLSGFGIVSQTSSVRCMRRHAVHRTRTGTLTTRVCRHDETIRGSDAPNRELLAYCDHRG